MAADEPREFLDLAGSLGVSAQEALKAASLILRHRASRMPLMQTGADLQWSHWIRRVIEQQETLPHAQIATEALEPYWWTGLEKERSELAALARFAHRVDYATVHLCIAFEKAGVQDFESSLPRTGLPSPSGTGAWYAAIVDATFHRYQILRKALLHHWTLSGESMPWTLNALLILSDLTPAGSKLCNHFPTDPAGTLQELVQHLDIVAEQLMAAIRLPESVESSAVRNESRDDDARLDAVQAAILEKAGESLSLTGAAKRLGVTRQALHKRIQAGSAIGVMRGAELVVPSAQLVERGGKPAIVSGLNKIVVLFDKARAGRWSALQFLTEVDPLLKAIPLEVLKRGDVGPVVAAARSYLSLDEA